MKKILSLLLVTITTLSLVACGSDTKTNGGSSNSNTETEAPEEKLGSDLTDEYLLSLPESPIELFSYEELDDGSGISITNYNASENNYDKEAIIVVPTEIDGKPVKWISKEAFYNTNLKAVVISGEVERIGTDAFAAATIEKVLITSPINDWGDNAFMISNIKELVFTSAETIGCLCFNGAKIDLLKIPNTVKTITYSAFMLTQSEKLIIDGDCDATGAFLSADKIKKVVCTTGNIILNKENGDFLSASASLSGSGKMGETIIVAPADSKIAQYAKENNLNFEELK